MRILLPIIQFPPDINPTGVLMAQLCDGLTAYGHEVSVLTTFPHYENFRIWQQYRGKLIERGQERGMEIARLYIYAPGKKSMINRLVSYVTFNSLATLMGVFTRRQWDVILCPNGSFFSGITAWLIGKAKRTPFVFNIQDLYPDVPVRAGQLRSRPAIAMLKATEAFMYRKAAHITVIAPAFRDNLLAKKVPAEKISIIANFVDTEFIRPLPKINGFAEQHGLADKFVVTHAGNLGYVYDLKTMLKAAALLAARKDILFLIVGNGVSKVELEKAAADLQLTNVRFMPFQPRDSLPWLRAASDLQVSLYKRGAANDSFPSKIYEIMASGRPLLASADANSAVASIVQSAGCGVCVEPGAPEMLADAIVELYDNRQLRECMGQRGRRYAVEHHSKQVVVDRYQDILQRVCR